MRPIKFRVFYSGKMIFPAQFLCDRGEIKSCFHSDNEVPQIKGPNNDMGYEITQFTGLLDKNGKEVYEGDIVKYKEHEGYLLGDFIAEVFWKDTQWAFGRSDGKMYDVNLSEADELEDDILNHLEVIGNIYENPDLISNK